ncbi:hypothetical protein Bbelb_445200 [Branchiostoma belcheri]|nr:hypothetical protein Bbelb_445200 [Branchiostoma belcheri]
MAINKRLYPVITAESLPLTSLRAEDRAAELKVAVTCSISLGPGLCTAARPGPSGPFPHFQPNFNYFYSRFLHNVTTSLLQVVRKRHVITKGKLSTPEVPNQQADMKHRAGFAIGLPFRRFRT